MISLVGDQDTIKFIASANKAVKKPGRTYHWECPFCAGIVQGGKRVSNEKVYGKCDNCKMSLERDGWLST